MSIPPTLQTTKDFNLNSKQLKTKPLIDDSKEINSIISLNLINLKIRLLNLISLQKLTVNLIDFLTTQRQSSLLVSLVYINKSLINLLNQLNYFKNLLISNEKNHTSSMSSLSFMKIIETEFQDFLVQNYNYELNEKILPFYNDLKNHLKFFKLDPNYLEIINDLLTFNILIFKEHSPLQAMMTSSTPSHNEEDKLYKKMVELNTKITFVSDSYKNYKSILLEIKNLEDDEGKTDFVVNHDDLSIYLENSLKNTKLIKDDKIEKGEEEIGLSSALSIPNKDLHMINSYEFQKFDNERKSNLQINDRKVFN